MNWTLIGAISVPLVSLLTIMGSAWVSRLSGKAAIRQATVSERRQASADWEAYATELRHRNDRLAERLENFEDEWVKRLASMEDAAKRRLMEVTTEYTERIGLMERRLGDSEVRAQAAEMRASRAEVLYSIAIVYLRRLSMWAADNLVGVDLPTPPPELENDLGAKS